MDLFPLARTVGRSTKIFFIKLFSIASRYTKRKLKLTLASYRIKNSRMFSFFFVLYGVEVITMHFIRRSLCRGITLAFLGYYVDKNWSRSWHGFHLLENGN